MKKVLIADKLDAEVITALRDLKLEVIDRPELAANELPAHIEEVAILVVRSTQVTQATIDKGRALGLIVRAGAGVNTIDVTAASRSGIYVANCPGVNAAAVAELAIGLIVAADRRIVDACSEMRDGRWRKKEYGKARGLRGRTLGLVGFGAIAKAVAAAAQSLGMSVLAWSRSLRDEDAEAHGVQRANSPLDVARQSDVVSLHLALVPETRHIVNADFLDQMKPGAILVNTARGELIDTHALRAALAAKRIKFAADTVEEEPDSGDAEFPDRDLAAQIVCTPHIGASTDQTSEAIGREVVRIVRDYIESGNVRGAVNMLEKTPATHHLIVRHFNRVGVLATILDGLREERINVEEMQNRIFDQMAAAVCTLALDSAPSQAFITQLARDENVLQVTLSDACDQDGQS